MTPSKIDHFKRLFEQDLLRELGAITRLPQQTVLRLAREQAEELLALYLGECSGKQAAQKIAHLIDADRAREAYTAPVSAGWR